ncbi:MAG: enoyl-CoA hydratase/isomerase family protein [Sandaracinaceae bacterium]|nr:enoyl-CoA hydratase/isomerase family protein [Sandaracinaceae bacterium]
MELRLHTVSVPALLGRQSLEAFERALDAAPSDRPWLLRAESDIAFCRGMDLGEAAANVHEASVRRFARVLTGLSRAPVPTLALVDGEARGGGVGIAAACDLVVATDRASFALPEALFGLQPAAIAPVLLTRLAPQKLRLWAIRASAIDAVEAERIGLVDRSIDRDHIASALRRATRELSRASLDALPALRALCARALLLEQDDAITAGAEHTLDRLREPVIQERLRAFIDDGAAPWSS